MQQHLAGDRVETVAKTGIHLCSAHGIAQQELIAGDAAAAVKLGKAGIVRREPVPAAGRVLAIERGEDEIARFQEIAALIGDHFNDGIKPFPLAAALGEHGVFREEARKHFGMLARAAAFNDGIGQRCVDPACHAVQHGCGAGGEKIGGELAIGAAAGHKGRLGAEFGADTGEALCAIGAGFKPRRQRRARPQALAPAWGGLAQGDSRGRCIFRGRPENFQNVHG